jgi:hypothetical protein
MREKERRTDKCINREEKDKRETTESEREREKNRDVRTDRRTEGGDKVLLLE